MSGSAPGLIAGEHDLEINTPKVVSSLYLRNVKILPLTTAISIVPERPARAIQ
jgi:hypothetical protein